MPTNAKTRRVIAAAACLAVATASASGDFMRVSVERDAIFTPGQMRVTVNLSERTELAGPYEVRLTAFLAGLTVRELTTSVSRGAPASFEVPFPRMQARSEVRCRVELSLQGEFLEAVEQPVFLWPPMVPLDARHRPKDVWVLDASGRLQRAFREMDVNAVDAAFQGVRDFASSAVVFVGESSEMRAVQMILDQVRQAPRPPVVVFLRQRQFPKELEIEAVSDVNSPGSIVCDMNAPLLKGLTRLDIGSLVSQAVGIERRSRSGITRSFVGGGPHRTYLYTVNADGRAYVFCQLPVMDPCDPRQVTLLGNLVEFAAAEADRRRTL